MTRTDIFAVIVNCRYGTICRNTLTLLWHFYSSYPTSFAFHCVKQLAPKLNTLQLSFITLIRSRKDGCDLEGLFQIRYLICGQPLTAAVFGKLDFSLVLQLPCHFSVTEKNILTLIFNMLFDWYSLHTNTNNQFSLMKGLHWHQPVWIQEHKTIYRKEIP